MSNSAPYPGLYVGSTIHARPNGTSRFTYRLFSLLIDVDRPEAMQHAAPMLRIEKPGLLSFYAKDHGDRSGAPLRAWAEETFRAAGIELNDGPIRLLTMPRVFGFVFNPISLFFGYGPDAQLRGVIYEVNNTFGETHCYVAPLAADKTHQHSADKEFHVSPFFDVSGRYEFSLRAPGDDFNLKIVKRKDGAADHIAAWTAERRPLNNRSLRQAWRTSPLLTFWVVASIHWQAVRVWLRGARYHRKPRARAVSVTVAAPLLAQKIEARSPIVDPLLEHI